MLNYKRTKYIAEKTGNELIYWFHLAMLFIIGGTVLVSAAEMFFQIFESGHAGIENILLLFIYLELGAMVGIYFATSRMPVNFLIYIGITALTRAIIGYLPHDHQVSTDSLVLVGAILILALSAMILKFSSATFTIKPKKGREALFARKKSDKNT